MRKSIESDVELLAQFGARIEPARIDLRRDPAELVDQDGGDVVASHNFSGLCSRRSISARNRAPRWPSLARWSAARVAVSTRRADHLSRDSPGPFDGHTKADKRDLGRIDDAEHRLDAALSEIGDRDRRIRQLGAAQRAAARAGDEISQLRHQLVERQLVCVADGRCDQPATTDCNRRPDMDAGAGLKPLGSEEPVELRGLAEGTRDRLEQ